MDQPEDISKSIEKAAKEIQQKTGAPPRTAVYAAAMGLLRTIKNKK